MRHDHWQSKLQAYVDSMRDLRFAYGSFDCGLFAAGCIEAMTGNDLAEEFRGYTNRAGAMEASMRVCGSSSIAKLGEYIADKYELAEVPILFAQRGDLAIVKNRRFGIVALNGTEIMVPGRIGLIRYPFEAATKVYRV